MTDLLYKEEVYEIIGVCMGVYNELGYGFLEIVYKDAMELEFIENEMEHQREQEFPVLYKGKKLKRTFFSDFALFEKIIVEVKTNADGIGEDSIAQTLNYLKVSGYRVGLIINFGKRKLEFKRLIF
jgi:GxxExxY protein